MIIEVDSSTGQVLGVIGGHGEGPGEYRDIGFLFMKGDSLVHQNPGSGALTIYAPGDRRYVRTQSFDVPMHMSEAFLLRGDTMFVAQPLWSPEQAGLPLHIVAPDGRLLKSFGTDDRTVDPEFFTAQLRTIARATDSSVWVARRDRYEVELWNTSGTREKALTPQRDWFTPLLRDVANPFLERPGTQLGGICLDSHGHLVVVLLRARGDWAPVSKGSGEAFPVVDPLTRLDPFELVIEILDTESGSLLASRVFPDLNATGRFLPNGLLVGYVPTKDEAPALALWSITHRDRRLTP